MANIELTTIMWAVLGGMVPTFLWLWFWLSEDTQQDPPGLLFLAYVAGMGSLFIIMPMKAFVQSFPFQPREVIVIYAILEELIKFGIIAVVTFPTRYLTDPIDYGIFLITGALGFSGLENTLYLIQSITDGHSTIVSSLMTGNIRFLGATVLHTVTAGVIGIMLGLAFYRGAFLKTVNLVIGLGLAIGLHSVFNYFIMKETSRETMLAIIGIWFVAVIVIVVFQRLKSLSAQFKQS